MDIVYLPLPNSLHVEWTLRAVDAGKHVLCEKPLALSAADVDRITVVARARGVVVAEAFMYRHEPFTARLRQLLHDERVVGELRHISAGFTFLQTRQPDARLDPALGGGSLWDVGCYAVDIVRLLARAEPLAVQGVAQRGPTGVDLTFNGTLQFASGLLASVHSGFTAALHTWLTVTGEHGVLTARHPFKPGSREAMTLTRGDETTAVVVEGSPLLFVRQVQNFAAAVREQQLPHVSLADSRGNAATLAALHRSAEYGCTVQLS